MILVWGTIGSLIKAIDPKSVIPSLQASLVLYVQCQLRTQGEIGRGVKVVWKDLKLRRLSRVSSAVSLPGGC